MEDVSQSGHDALWPSIVDLRVNTVDITRRSQHPVGLLFKHENPVPAMSRVRTVERQAKFERHVKAGDPRCQFNSRKIVNRNVRLLNQPYNSFEPPLVRDGERCVDFQTELRKAYDVCEV